MGKRLTLFYNYLYSFQISEAPMPVISFTPIPGTPLSKFIAVHKVVMSLRLPVPRIHEARKSMIPRSRCPSKHLITLLENDSGPRKISFEASKIISAIDLATSTLETDEKLTMMSLKLGVSGR